MTQTHHVYPFIAVISHDLRSPLTAIRTSVESLLDENGVQSSTSQEQLLRTIADQTDRMSELVDTLLDISLMEEGQLTLDGDWIELPVFIRDTIAEIHSLHRDFHIELTIDPHISLAYVDPHRLTQVLWNLLENARKYAPMNASIEVDVCLTMEREVLVSVADAGPGIPCEEREKIFQQFYRMERDRGSSTRGTGLGLAICRGIVEAHGGRIWIEDNGQSNNQGSTFLFTLPLSTKEW